MKELPSEKLKRIEEELLEIEKELRELDGTESSFALKDESDSKRFVSEVEKVRE